MKINNLPTTLQKILALSLVFFSFTACTGNKEEKLRQSLKAPPPQQLDFVEKAKSSPSFENDINAGLSLSQKGDHDSAITYYRSAMNRNPSSPIPYNNICSELNAQKKWYLAIEMCHQALQHAAEFELAKNNLKLAESQMKIQIQEIEKLEKLEKASSSEKKRQLLVDIGHEYYKMGHFSQAVEIWSKVKMKKDALDVTLLNNLGSANILLKNFDLAESQLKSALALAPENALVKRNLQWLEAAKKSQ